MCTTLSPTDLSVQMRTVKPSGLREAIELNRPSRASNPPATQCGGRHMGERQWHGNAQYGKFWPAANKTFQVGNFPAISRSKTS